MFGTSKVQRAQIHPVTGVILDGRHQGKSVGKLGRHLRAMPSSATGDAFVYDERRWDVVEDFYNENPPTDEDGNRITPAYPLVIGWLIPAA